METSGNTKKRILEASENLFSHYGFNKTTMAEIAKECNMSAANIYRFYESKEDILAEIANLNFRRIEDSLREELRRPGPSAAERLESFIVHILRHINDMFTCKPKISEAVEYIHKKRYDLIDRHMEAKRSMVAEILAEGNRNGEFDTEDIVVTAGLILNTISNLCPAPYGCINISETEKMARGIVRLLIKGLEKR